MVWVSQGFPWDWDECWYADNSSNLRYFSFKIDEIVEIYGYSDWLIPLEGGGLSQNEYLYTTTTKNFTPYERLFHF